MNWLFVFLGGGIGAGLRYMLSLVLGKTASGFPVSTLFTNILGCLIIGLVAGLSEKNNWSDAYKLFIMVGILGGFTTFSSFGLEFYQMMKNNQTLSALLYVGLSNFVGLGLCALGYNWIK
ncbi:MAG: fluoride efflux transporter CrcB [Bacteroidetes bacterium]|nr:fluoride efflux transporter CrcB [Bacteroidota bacterium]